jgi:hypothetical protein
MGSKENFKIFAQADASRKNVTLPSLPGQGRCFLWLASLRPELGSPPQVRLAT